MGVVLEAEATDAEHAAVAAAFVEAGIDAHVRIDPDCKGAGGEFPWMVVISFPATAFFAAFSAEAGKDTYQSLKRFINRRYDARKGSRFKTGMVILLDVDTGTSVTLPPEIPDDVWQQLPDTGPHAWPPGVFRWDPETGKRRNA